MSQIPAHSLILVFAPLNNISAQCDHKELQTALLNAINCNEVPGSKVGHNKLSPKFITIPSSGRPVNAIALKISRRRKTTLSKFEERLPLLVHIETGDLLDDFKRALEYQNLQLLHSHQIPENSNDTIQSIVDSLGLHLSHDGTKLKCSMLKDDIHTLYQDTALHDSTASVSSHNPNVSAMSPRSIQPHSTAPMVGQPCDSVIITSHQHGLRPGGLSGQALAFRLHKNLKHIPASHKSSEISTNIQREMERHQGDDIWRITLFVAHTHQISDSLSNPEKCARGQQLANMLNTLSGDCFVYKKNFIPSLSATRTTLHGLAAKLLIKTFKTNEEIAQKIYWTYLGCVHIHLKAWIVASANEWDREHPILLEYTIPTGLTAQKYHAFVTGSGESETSMPWTATYHSNPHLFTLVFNKILQPTRPLFTTRVSQRLSTHSSLPLINKIISDIDALSLNPELGILQSRLLGLWIELCWKGAKTIKHVHQWYVANPWLWNSLCILSNRKTKSERLQNFLIEELKKLPSPQDCAGWALPFTEPCTVMDEATGKQEQRDHHWVLLLPWSSNRSIELLDSLGRPRSSLVKEQKSAIHLIQELTKHIFIEDQFYSPLSPDKMAHFKSIIQQWKIEPLHREKLQTNTLDCGFWAAIQTLGLMSYGIPLTWTEAGMIEVRQFVLGHLKAAQDRKDPSLERVAENEQAYAQSQMW